MVDQSECARKALDWIDSVDKLKDGFGARGTEDNFKMFAQTCKVDVQSQHIIRRVIEDGIVAYDDKDHEDAVKHFNVARIMGAVVALERISKGDSKMERKYLDLLGRTPMKEGK